MSANLREAVHEAADKLPENRLAEVLNLMQLLIEVEDNPDVEVEELWLLSSGKLKEMVDEIEDGHANKPESGIEQLWQHPNESA